MHVECAAYAISFDLTKSSAFPNRIAAMPPCTPGNVDLLIRPDEVLSDILQGLIMEKAFYPIRRLCQLSHRFIGSLG
jgi:hypothetical protein